MYIQLLLILELAWHLEAERLEGIICLLIPEIPVCALTFLIKCVDLSSASEATVVTDTATEVIVPQQLLGFIYGENGSNLSQIRQVGSLPPLFVLTNQLGYCKSSSP